MTAATPPRAMMKELRHQVARAISEAKAYNVPALCRRLGLQDGSESEAFQSKYKYAERRLIEAPDASVLKMARELAAEDLHFEPAEQLTKIEELDEPAVTALTRRRLIALFDDAPLATEIEDIELIRGIWPIGQMPAPLNSPERTLESHVYRHTVAFHDLSQRELLETLGLLTCSRAQLFRFLAAVTAPDAQTPEGQRSLAEEINKHLKHDGYTLVVAGKISGSPYYEAKSTPLGSPADDSISASLAAFDPDQVHNRWQEALDRRATQPDGAITLARTLLEDVCKWILEEAGETWKEKDDLPQLYRRLAKLLKLAPDAHTEQVFKQILGNCQSVVEALGALRNKLGDAHSPGPKRARPQPRHAELAVNLAGTMATFLVSTWRARQSERSAQNPSTRSPTSVASR